MEQNEFLEQQAFHGKEKKPVPALLGLMNMVLHRVTAPNVARRNTLQENIEAEAHRHPVEITASLPEKEREILSIIEELHEMVGDGNGNATRF